MHRKNIRIRGWKWDNKRIRWWLRMRNQNIIEHETKKKKIIKECRPKILEWQYIYLKDIRRIQWKWENNKRINNE